MTSHDNYLHAEADRRSAPAQPERDLADAVWWLAHDALVPHHRINGLVLDGEVYDAAGYLRTTEADALRRAADRLTRELIGHDGLRHEVVDAKALRDLANRIQAGEAP